jgi:aryl-alcohol dehydrogenase-like predicted oxidoreductase
VTIGTGAGTVTVGGDLTIDRLGYGAMQITGRGVWGPPRDHDEAIRVLRRTVELGITFIDTADSYGPHVSEELIREALHPYPEELVIATKAGQVRPAAWEWVPLGRPEYLRQQVELGLRRLGLERIDLFQLHRIDPNVPLEDQLGVLVDLQQEGKIRHIGMSEVSLAELRRARELAPIASVTNEYNLAKRSAEDVLDYAEAEGLAFIPWFPMAMGKLAEPGGPLDAIANDLGATPAQVALAWLLRRSPAMIPIPGTSSVAHLEENVAAAALRLSDEDFVALSHKVGPPPA